MTSVRLATGAAYADIALTGAELQAWVVRGVPLIWTPDLAIWSASAPVLFPVVGWSRGGRILVDGVSYPLGVHGFAHAHTFKVVERSPASLRLRLESTVDTRASYPFEWIFEVSYTLDAASLTVELSIHNFGAAAMPYACGLHPGINWPFAGGEADDYVVDFAETEEARVPVISTEGLFTHETREVPLAAKRLPLSRALMAREAICFLNAKSRSLRFARHSLAPAIKVDLRDFPHIALWSRPNGRFLCVEAWTGHGDYVDADGDLFRKPSMRHLLPGATASHAATFSLVTS